MSRLNSVYVADTSNWYNNRSQHSAEQYVTALHSSAKQLPCIEHNTARHHAKLLKEALTDRFYLFTSTFNHQYNKDKQNSTWKTHHYKIIKERRRAGLHDYRERKLFRKDLLTPFLQHI